MSDVDAEVFMLPWQGILIFELIFKMMDRSNVRETHLRQSYVFQNGSSSMQRSYISTSLVNDSLSYGDDLRKSRIQNLPNYRKTNLGDNIQFIVVFQTIEIERLSNEVELLRVRLKENERQLFNFHNYEVQIRELNEKCFALENERADYRDEIDKLTKICETLYHENETLQKRLQENDYSIKQKFESERLKNQQLMSEIEKWKNRYQATERSKTKELDDLRNLMESQRKSMIDRQIREITIRFQNERSQLENEIRKGREMLDNRNREIDDQKQKIQRYQISLMELRNYETMIHDFENKITLLNQELLRLNQVLKAKEEDLHDFKQREFKLSQRLKEQDQWDHENKQLKTTLENRVREIEEWKVRNSRLEEDANKAREMMHYNEEMSNKLQVSGREIERLNNVLRNKLDEIEQWKKKVSDREMELSKLKNVEDDLANYESKFGMMQAENDRINGLLRTRQGEIEDWKNRHSKLEVTINNFTHVEKDRENLQNKLNDQVRAGQEMEFTLKSMQKDMDNYRRYETQFQDAEREKANLGKQIERLNNIIRSNSNELRDFQTRYSQLEGSMQEYKNIEMKVRDFENKIAMLVQENERLNTLIRAKNDDIDQLEKDKLEMHTQVSHYKNYEIKINENQMLVKRLNDQIHNLKTENGNWETKLREVEGRSGEFERVLYENNKEKEKLSNMIKAKANEYDQLRSKYAQLESECRKASELQMVCQEQHNQMLIQSSDIERMEIKIKDVEGQLEKERGLVNELSFRVIVLSSEIERLAGGGGGSGGMKTREYEELKESYSRLQSKVVSKNNEIDILLTKVSSLESQISKLSQQFNRLLAEATRSENESKAMTNKIEEYQDYAKRIHILGAEIDRLQAENKAYDEDARRIRLKFADGLSMEKREQDFNFMMVLMAVELESLRSKLDQREISLDEMRKSILEPVRRV